MKHTLLPLLLTTAPLFAGEPAPMMAPAPVAPCDCPQGFTLGLEAMALRPFQSDGGFDSEDYDFGFRATIGYEFSDCLFVRLVGFGYSTDTNDFSDSYTDGNYQYSEKFDSDMDAAYVDLVVGQHFTPGDKLTLSPYVGLRWAKLDQGYSWSDSDTYDYGEGDVDRYSSSEKGNNDFSGLGIVVGIDGTRSLGNNFSLYGTAKTSVVFGETDHDWSDTYNGESDGSGSYSTDEVVFISELGLGLQYDFCFSNVAANIRLGVEGQWWAGAGVGDSDESNSGSENIGLAGFVLGANFRF